ncbi:uncharacterized protein LOC107965070 isoform X2 [Apis mellifera]|uniref:Uncharacterized protein LOC107965070 isoform X2 n=1 Tax=Apis mellifera TaxID=7460 RepID=A0A7M7MPY2_APIME|nr:uncharacterized protein LOC107965070 isoform X2 [Apis mellifera]|eukprot:XP_026299238.1 uncharacterized protein LOC107965070 isoform X2 [Apis mellifera]
MNFSILVLLIIGINCTKAYHKVSATTEHSKIIHRSLRETTTNSSNVQIPEKKISLTDILYSKQNLTKLEGLEKNTKKEVSNRKSKILRSLAYLAGLTVGNLTNAASTDVKTYTKFPSLNVDTSPLATIYNPYPYLTYPYIFATPVGFYPPLLNLLDNKIIGQLKEEYGEEAQKIENIKMPNNEQSKNTEDTEAEENQNEEGKKEVNAKQSNTLKNIVQDNSFTLALRVANTTNTTAGNMTHTDNSTQSPSFYYGGYPQNIHVIDFTTKTYEPYYHSYGYGNYDLPYNTPIPNFHLDKTYINYPVDHYPYVGHYPHVDHYPGQFHQQIPQYDPNDFNRFSYTPDNIPSFANNDFKPIV